MTVGADLDVQLGLGGTGPELVAAGAAHVGRHVLGVDIGLHRLFDSSDHLRGRPSRPLGHGDGAATPAAVPTTSKGGRSGPAPAAWRPPARSTRRAASSPRSGAPARRSPVLRGAVARSRGRAGALSRAPPRPGR